MGSLTNIFNQTSSLLKKNTPIKSSSEVSLLQQLLPNNIEYIIKQTDVTYQNSNQNRTVQIIAQLKEASPYTLLVEYEPSSPTSVIYWQLDRQFVSNEAHLTPTTIQQLVQNQIKLPIKKDFTCQQIPLQKPFVCYSTWQDSNSNKIISKATVSPFTNLTTISLTICNYNKSVAQSHVNDCLPFANWQALEHVI